MIALAIMRIILKVVMKETVNVLILMNRTGQGYVDYYVLFFQYRYN